LGSAYSKDVGLVAATTGVQHYDGAGNYVTCYSFTWTIPKGYQCWATVSAIVDGEEGGPSIEVGPLTGQNPVWDVTPRAIGGYQQVYLDWPDDPAFCQYDVRYTALNPGQNNLDDSDWIALADGLTEPRFWHTNLQPSEFYLADLKNTGAFITQVSDPGSPLSAYFCVRFAEFNAVASSDRAKQIAADAGVPMPASPTVQDVLGLYTNSSSSFSSSDLQNLRSDLVTALGGIIHGSCIYSPSRFAGVTLGADARSLVADWPNLSTEDAMRLNRYLIEDSFVTGIAAFRDPRYYMVDATICGGGQAYQSHWVAGRPSDTATNPPMLSFSAQAFAYDSMALVQWYVPGTTNEVPPGDSSWQFSVQRRAEGSTQYTTLTSAGFGLSYLDQDVIDGQTYQYRVIAFDTDYNRYSADTAQVTPSFTNGLALLDPKPGNTYVDLSWSPIRAAAFTIKHALNHDGPFEDLATLYSSSAYQSAAASFRHKGAQNGIDHYYQVIATTPTGLEIVSDVKSARPLASLAPLPPDGFQAEMTSGTGGNHALLTWQARTGASQYMTALESPKLLGSTMFRKTPLMGQRWCSPSVASTPPVWWAILRRLPSRTQPRPCPVIRTLSVSRSAAWWPTGAR
jgi:hypothetical protein